MSEVLWVVVEANDRYRFAKLVAEATGEECHSELYPDVGEEEDAHLELRVGDRVAGLRRGQSLHKVRWVTRAPPPSEHVGKMDRLIHRLASLGVQLSLTPQLLAERVWRKAKGPNPLLEALRPPLLPLFAWESAHPFEDAGLLDRFVAATRRHLPQLAVRPVAGKASFRLEPGDLEVEAGGPTPTPLFAPLVHQVNALLEQSGAEVRWTPIRDNWVLARPKVVEALVDAGLLEPPLLA